MSEIFFLIIGIIIGLLASRLIFKFRDKSIYLAQQIEIDNLNTQINELRYGKGTIEEKNLLLEKDILKNKSELDEK